MEMLNGVLCSNPAPATIRDQDLVWAYFEGTPPDAPSGRAARHSCGYQLRRSFDSECREGVIHLRASLLTLIVASRQVS
jgi:hypothetical protein